MNRPLIFLLGTGLLACAAASRADDGLARSAVDQAFARQRALPAYVEHQFGHLPVEAGAAAALADIVIDRAKDKATERIQQKLAKATAHNPALAEATELAEARLTAEAAESIPSWGPLREILTVEHAGRLERQVLADGQAELVRDGEHTAYKFNVPPQVSALLAGSAVESSVEVAREARSAIGAIKALSSVLSKGATGDVFGAATAAFDAVTGLLTNARTAADLIQAAAMMQKLSGAWQCQPARVGSFYPSQLIDVEQLADEAVGGAATHVYFMVQSFGPALDGFQLESRVWIRIADGLPVRSEMAWPGGETLQTDYDYPPSVAIAVPSCQAPM